MNARTDVANAFFFRHYPADLDRAKYSRWEGDGWRYEGPNQNARIFPAMVCADGFKMSVQGHHGGYSDPRDDFSEDGYAQVEIYLVSAPEPLLNEWETRERERIGYDKPTTERAGMDAPMGYVPVELVVAVIEKHGGLRP